MAELHRVDVETVGGEEQTESEIAATRNVRLWLEPARQVMHLYSNSFQTEMREALDLDRFLADWNRYMTWLKKWEQTRGASKRVFAHNDTQCGNLLRLKRLKPALPDHHQVSDSHYKFHDFPLTLTMLAYYPQTTQRYSLDV